MVDYWGAPVDLTPASLAGGDPGTGEIWSAAVDQITLVDNTNAAHAALERAYGERSRTIRALTGIDLGNPMTAPRPELAALGLAGGLLAEYGGPSRPAAEAYQQRLEELAAQFPQHAGAIKADVPMERDAEAIARTADARLGEALAASPGWGSGALAFGGGMAGSLRDPLTIGSLFVGGGPGGARTAVGRILTTAASEALVNAGTELVAQPFVQDWRQRAGLPNGLDEATRNVLLAAALGGTFGGALRGGHETVAALTRIRGALPADARGALDAAQSLDDLDAVAPAGVAPERHERLAAAADAALQGQRIDPPEPDEAEINRIVNSLAPSPDSVSGRSGVRTDEDINRLVTTQPETANGRQRVPKPIFEHIRNLGGVDPASPIAAELRAAAVDTPSLFRKGGLRDLDNLPHDELPAEVRHTIEADGNGYASRQGVIDGIARELEGPDGVRMADDERGFLARQGVDFSRPIEEVRAQIRDVDDALFRWTAESDEVATVPEGLTRRQYTEQLVREVLRQHPGLSPELIRRAVNLSLFERQPIGAALEDVLSDAAGVPRSPKSTTVRFYHGTTLKDASEFSGKTWVTPHYDYARNYRGGPNNVLFVDLTKEEAIAERLWDEVNDYPIHGPIENASSRLKPLSEEPAAPPALADEPEPLRADLDGEDIELDLTAEREALEALGFTGDLPVGDELISFAALEEQLEALSWEAKVVEACKV